jgi:hypothetical protein
LVGKSVSSALEMGDDIQGAVTKAFEKSTSFPPEMVSEYATRATKKYNEVIADGGDAADAFAEAGAVVGVMIDSARAQSPYRAQSRYRRLDAFVAPGLGYHEGQCINMDKPGSGFDVGAESYSFSALKERPVSSSSAFSQALMDIKLSKPGAAARASSSVIKVAERVWEWHDGARSVLVTQMPNHPLQQIVTKTDENGHVVQVQTIFGQWFHCQEGTSKEFKTLTSQGFSPEARVEFKGDGVTTVFEEGSAQDLQTKTFLYHSTDSKSNHKTEVTETPEGRPLKIVHQGDAEKLFDSLIVGNWNLDVDHADFEKAWEWAPDNCAARVSNVVASHWPGESHDLSDTSLNLPVSGKIYVDSKGHSHKIPKMTSSLTEDANDIAFYAAALAAVCGNDVANDLCRLGAAHGIYWSQIVQQKSESYKSYATALSRNSEVSLPACSDVDQGQAMPFDTLLWDACAVNENEVRLDNGRSKTVTPKAGSLKDSTLRVSSNGEARIATIGNMKAMKRNPALTASVSTLQHGQADEYRYGVPVGTFNGNEIRCVFDVAFSGAKTLGTSAGVQLCQPSDSKDKCPKKPFAQPRCYHVDQNEQITDGPSVSASNFYVDALWDSKSQDLILTMTFDLEVAAGRGDGLKKQVLLTNHDASSHPSDDAIQTLTQGIHPTPAAIASSQNAHKDVLTHRCRLGVVNADQCKER